MADGTYRYQTTGHNVLFHHQQSPHNPRQLARSGSPVNNGRVGFITDSASPSRSPGTRSPARGIYNMYNQGGHQQGQHPMLNGGGPSNRNYSAMQMNLAHKMSNQQTHQHPQQHGHHYHHHQQPDNSGHGPAAMGHQHSFSSGTLNATPHFTPSHLPNGNASNAASNAATYSEHWQQQLQMVQEARSSTTPHHFARTLAKENKGISYPLDATPRRGKEVDHEERNRISNTKRCRQDWETLDFSGQGLHNLTPPLFRYQFLSKLHLNFNKLTHLPPMIGQLKNLTHLDLSNNEISEVPPEIGMLVNMRTLFLFDNKIHTLPFEMGSMFQLETLGIEGNPLQDDLKLEIMQNGTKSLITHLRENAPGRRI
jgi:CCR4-NOT transcription complex subunit 6